MLRQISSVNNSKIKLVRKLLTSKGRSRESRFTAEGVNLVTEIIEGGFDIDFLVVSERFRSAEGERAGAIRTYIERADTFALEVSEEIFDGLRDAENGIDVLAVVKSRRLSTDYIDSLPEDGCILVCDRIQDPGNMGTMIRTAVAAGYGAVVVLPGTVDIYSPKVLRATAGMVFEIPIIHAEGEADIKAMAERTGRRIAVSVPSGGREYFKEDLSRGVVLVIGNEGGGISKEIEDIADIRVTLPMKGNTESLNAAVAAAILMYEAVRS
ncbi:MAG: RNA methyltransferase [Mogibacterium sp.]|nr:RNA methyltransferase [Mogibacterium sp.]